MSHLSMKDRLKGWNEHRRWRLPDIHSHPKFRKAAINITRAGFLGKAILYGAMGCIATIAAAGTDKEIDQAQGPQTVLQTFNSRGGEAALFFFAIGLMCYSVFAFLFCFFDFDQLGHHSAMAVLSRFGRIFSSGFYGFLAAYSIELLMKVRQGDSFTLSLARYLFATTAGRVVLCFLGFVFFVVAIVYFSYIIKPAKFRRELASENMPPALFYTSVWIARGGAIGRVLFFGAFGGVMFDSVISNRGVQQGNQSILGFEGVLNRLALTSRSLLFVTGGFLMLYALWCLILSAFRRLPAHYNEKESLNCVGVRYKVWKETRHQNSLIRRQVAMAKLATGAGTYGTAEDDGVSNNAVVTTPLMVRPSFNKEPSVSLTKGVASDDGCTDDEYCTPPPSEVAIHIAKSGEVIKKGLETSIDIKSSGDSMYRQSRPYFVQGSRSSNQFGGGNFVDDPSVTGISVEPVFEEIPLTVPLPLQTDINKSGQVPDKEGIASR
eukprot:TRINITY_DN2153_c0_g1_i1.p1 TRINITY_DN2153_c0_g1~~TRINITY_DN2153_c0_g1_i1.p1  ORF type:complete len:492 (-),score=119.96 TRINITY_DN2153_c0_g1_i1:155-1630(-)